ncbi:MAG TPA: MFS transporter [Candidatus Binataceae bacterium]|jgi:MFS family permease|nr:MFS transporter [Candidatus Binataceae bacterium]
MSDEMMESAPAAATPGRVETPGPSTSGLMIAFRALRHRNFRLYFFGQLTSLTGTWMQTVAQSWLVLQLTNSALMLGLVTFANYLPILLVALFAGVVVDHVDRRRLIIVAQVLMMLSALVLAGLTWTGTVRVSHVIMLAAFNGIVSSFDLPGRQAFVVEMVGMEDLPNAIALNSMMFNGARTIGPAVAGMLIYVVGTGTCFFLNGVSYLAVIWSLVAMRLPRRTVEGAGVDMLRRVREGMTYVWEHRPSRYLLLVVAINSGLGMQYSVLMPVFAQDILHAGSRGYGVLMGAQGVGAVIGAVSLAWRSGTPRGLRQSLTVGLFMTAIAIIGFGFSSSMAVSLITQLFIGAGLINYMATTNTLLQLFVSDELRGRVMSFYTLSFIGLAPLGALAMGYVGERLGPQAAVVICGALSLGCALFLLTRLGVIRSAQEAGASG